MIKTVESGTSWWLVELNTQVYSVPWTGELVFCIQVLCLVLIIPMFSLPFILGPVLQLVFPPTVYLQAPRWLRLEGQFPVRAHGPLSFIPCLLLPVHPSGTVISDVLMWCSPFLLGCVFFDLLDSCLWTIFCLKLFAKHTLCFMQSSKFCLNDAQTIPYLCESLLAGLGSLT